MRYLSATESRHWVRWAAPGAVVAALACQSPRNAELRDGHSGSAQPAPAPKTAPPPPAPATLYLPATESSAAPKPDEPGRQMAQPSQGKTQRVYRVAAVGDSLTDERVGGGRFLKELRALCPDSTFDDYGVGGDMVNQMRRRFSSQVLADPAKYSHVLVFGGVNDLYSDLTAGRTPAKIERDLEWMYGQAHQAGLAVVAVTVAPWGGFKRYFNERRAAATLELNEWIKGQRAAGTVDSLVDAYPLLSCGDPERLCPRYMAPYKDGLHFGPLGHEALAHALHDTAFADCR